MQNIPPFLSTHLLVSFKCSNAGKTLHINPTNLHVVILRSNCFWQLKYVSHIIPVVFKRFVAHLGGGAAKKEHSKVNFDKIKVLRSPTSVYFPFNFVSLLIFHLVIDAPPTVAQ